MSRTLPTWAEKLIAPAAALVLAPVVLRIYGLELGFPAIWWRDHPFDYGNILHLKESFSLATRFWGYDPFHLFGWMPHVFYNPLATGLAALFSWPFRFSEGGYRIWLYFLTGISMLAPVLFLPAMPRRARWLGALVGGFGTLLVFPGDAGIIDANPVQVFYTGQWAQRLGIFWGLLALALYMRVAERGGWSSGARRLAVAAGASAGAALFCHFMSGYAAWAALGLSLLWYLAAEGASRRRFRADLVLVLVLALAAGVILFFDFFYVFFSLQRDYHSLPLLEWQVPQGALQVVQEPLLALLPLLLLPVMRLRQGWHSPPVKARMFFTAAVWALALFTQVKLLLPFFLLVGGLSLLASRRDAPSPRFFLPVAAWFFWLLACAPASLEFFGLEIWRILPFHGQLGFGKFAAFSRFLWFAWLGLVVAESLQEMSGRARPLAAVVALAALALPFLLPLASEKNSLQFFRWMSRTDRARTEEILKRMHEVAGETPPDGYLLVEDTLHHGEDSLLGDERVPFGHLPYLVGLAVGRPVLGGEVATRYLSHPLAQTARGAFLCAPPAARSEFFSALDVLREHGVSDLLVHNRPVVEALRGYAGAKLVDERAGLVHFALRPYRSILVADEGGGAAGPRLDWKGSGLAVWLPAQVASFSLRQVYSPFLVCTGSGGGECRLSGAGQAYALAGCLPQRPEAKITFEIPWLTGRREGEAGGERHCLISSRPALWPLLVMLGGWLAVLAWWVAGCRRAAASVREGD